jgi:DNA polymerase-3 subunit alpha
MRRRGEVIDYVRRKYGDQCVANIITYGTLGAKMVIRDVARVNSLAYADADRLAKMIPDELNITLEQAVTKSAELREELDRNPVAKRIFDQAAVLEGMVRNTGKHAAGIIITDRPLTEFVPLTLQEGDVTVQFDMNAVGKLGLLKMDFLGLKTLTVIADAVENIHRTADPKFDIEKIPFDDARTFALLNSGQTTGVFQLESGGMQNLCRQLQVSTIDEIIALIALYRPGPMDWIPDYVRGHRDPSTVKYPHPLLEKVCRDTYGVMVYQEQVMEAAKVIGGYTLGGADMLRRAMGKKDAAAMAKERDKFVAGAKRLHGIDERTSNAIFDILNKFAGYGFPKAHATAYAILSYQTGFLKANHPVQFMAAMLSTELGNSDKVAHFIAACGAIGIQVLGPDVNESRETFTPVGPRIRFGLAAIKGVGELAARRIIEEREANGPFRDFDDFLARVDGRAVNRRVLEHLAKTGAFDFSGAPRRRIFDGLDTAMAAVAAHARDRAAGQHSFLDMLADAPDAGPAATAVAAPTGPGPEAAEFPPADRLAYEKELLGFYISGHPLDAFERLTTALDTFPPEDLIRQPGRTEFRLCGIAGGIAKKLSKKDNRPWAAFTLETRRSSVALNMFADAYATYGGTLAENAAVVVLGNVIVGADGARINVRECYPLEGAVTSLARKVTWLLRPADLAVPEFLARLRETINAQPGETRVAFGFLFEDRAAAVAEASPALSWRLTAAAVQSLRSHPAVAGVQVEFKRLELKEDRRWARRG